MEKQQLTVKKSQIAGAGKGLFTKQEIKKGSIIIEYRGKVTTWKKIEENRSFNGYVYYITRNRVIDAKQDKKALGRYANDASGLVRTQGLRNNAQYVVRSKRVFIKAITTILPGAEILVGYGREYWSVIRYNNRLALKKKLKLQNKQG